MQSVGAILTANAHNKGMFLGGRFLTGNSLILYKLLVHVLMLAVGLGSGCAGASAKSYLAEMAPAHLRGA